MNFRVVIDANVWVSAIINPHGLPAILKQLWLSDRFDVVVCVKLIEEITGVLTRPKIQTKYHVSSEDIETIRRLLESKSIMENPLEDFGFSLRDPDDNYLIGLALASKSNFIVTGDRDLIDSVAIKDELSRLNIQVIKIADFFSILDEK